MAGEALEDTLRTPESGEDTKAEGKEEEVKLEGEGEETKVEGEGEEVKVEGQGEEVKAAAAKEDKDEGTPVGRKRSKKKVAAEEGVETTPVVKQRRKREAPATPVERPSRERKTVERFAALTPPRSSGSKTLSIQQGPGTKLRDIPNVLFKLNKRKVDDNLQHLHSILFSKRIKAFYVKKNILQFSGFVWTENKEKQREKVKERLEKCVKDKLLDFCEILDIPVHRTSTKKEDVSAKVLEFLESPHVTRDVVLADKEQSSKKRKRRKGSRVSGEKAKRGRKPSIKANNEQNEMEVEGDSADEEDKEDATEEDDLEGRELEEKNEPKEHSEEEEDGTEIHVEKKTHVVKKASPSKNKVRGTPKKGSDSKTVEKSPSKEGSEGKKRAKRGKQQPGKVSKEEKSDNKVSSADKAKDTKRLKRAKESPSKKLGGEHALQSAANANKGKGKTKSKKAAVQPTREEMHAVVSEILKEVDFNTATLADILRKLGAHFKMDLTDRKAEVKSIIEDVINSMTDDEGDDDEGDGEKEMSHDSSEGGDA